MKRIFVLVMMALLVCLPRARAQQGPDDQYLRIYYLVQEGDTLAEKEQPTEALGKYKEAQAALDAFQKGYPEWSPDVVKFRLNYLASQIAALTAKTAPPASKPAASSVLPEKPEPNQLQRQIGMLEAQVRQLQADNGLLQDKLKEALAARPTAADPTELAKAQEEVRKLQKANALLESTLAEQRSKAASAPAQAQPGATAAETSLAEASRALAEQKAVVDRLTKENETLHAQLKGAATPAANDGALREENERLKKALAQMSATPAAAPPANTPGMEERLSQAQAQITILQSDKALLRQEKTALEAQLKQMGGNKFQAQAGGGQEGQLATLQARLQAYEAQAVPYTPEELALFSHPTQAPEPANVIANKAGEPPTAKTTALLAEAQRLFSDRQFEKAEEKYVQVVRRDDRNAAALANLAVIQMQLKEMSQAEKNIERAVALAPNDAYNLSVLGQLRFRQGRYDEALDALSKAAKLEPKDPEIQNLLGITLGQKGMRLPAETAFRTAIELKPDFGQAHNNLALVYLSETPPRVELARWHYQKALDAGNPRNPKLEEMLAAHKAAQ